VSDLAGGNTTICPSQGKKRAQNQSEAVVLGDSTSR
jgi:hypothetical protein